jgi:hypothetical protein
MSDEDDIPSRANVPKLSEHPAYQQRAEPPDEFEEDADHTYE